MDERTDRPSYRDARTHLKTLIKAVSMQSMIKSALVLRWSCAGLALVERWLNVGAALIERCNETALISVVLCFSSLFPADHPCQVEINGETIVTAVFTSVLFIHFLARWMNPS